MSDNDVTVEMVEKELFEIVKGQGPAMGDVAMARVEAAKVLLPRLEKQKVMKSRSPGVVA